MDFGAQNEEWAGTLIDALVEQGITYFCCAPGSRSTSLALSVAAHPKAYFSIHFDERAVGFHALGYAKASGRPAAVLTTSGTAVGNLLPAIMEACNDKIPLILLTADRPPELRDCGANQTCDQVKLFQNYVRWQVDLPCPDARIPNRYLSGTIAQAVAMATSSPPGPVHLNCMMREPLFSSHLPPSKKSTSHVAFAHPQLHPSKETLEYWVEALSPHKQGIILAGSGTTGCLDAILALAERLQWPIFADILSAPRTQANHPCLITHFDPILKRKAASTQVGAIIQFGDRFVSKTLSLWLEQQKPEFFLHVSEHTMRQDPSHLLTHRLHASPSLFTSGLLLSLGQREEDTWLTSFKRLDQACKQALQEFFSSCQTLTEPGLIWEIASTLPESWALFFANSMPIRDANQFFSPQHTQCGPIFGNRGVSGIDGNIATLSGIAQGADRPVLAVLGDLSLLHDLTSLSYLRKSAHPIILCVVNNGGGGIFSFLPISQKKEVFEEFFATAHNTSFALAAKLFDLPYFHPKSSSELRDVLASARHSCLVEITTDRSENVRIHEQILTHLEGCLQLVELPGEIPILL